MRLYIYSLPFTFAMSFYDGRVTISLILSCVMFVFLLFRAVNSQIIFPYIAIVFLYFLFFLITLSIGGIFSGSLNEKSISHLVAYSLCIFCFGFIPVVAVSNISVPRWHQIIIYDATWTCRIAAVIVIVQFILSNFFGIFFEDYIYYPETIDAQSTFLGSLIRARGVAAEPGHYAFILEFFAPILFYSHSIGEKKSWTILPIDILFILLAMLSTGSPTGVIVLFWGFLISAAIFPSRRLYILFMGMLISVIIAVFIISIIASFQNMSWQDLLVLLVTDKIDSSSADEREQRFAVGLNLVSNASFIQFLFGYGPAVYVSQKLGDQTIIQLYLLLLAESGVIGLVLFMFGFWVLAKFAYVFIGHGRVYFFWALFCILLHYMFIANYYYPMLWSMFFLFVAMSESQDSVRHVNNTK